MVEDWIAWQGTIDENWGVDLADDLQYVHDGGFGPQIRNHIFPKTESASSAQVPQRSPPRSTAYVDSYVARPRRIKHPARLAGEYFCQRIHCANFAWDSVQTYAQQKLGSNCQKPGLDILLTQFGLRKRRHGSVGEFVLKWGFRRLHGGSQVWGVRRISHPEMLQMQVGVVLFARLPTASVEKAQTALSNVHQSVERCCWGWFKSQGGSQGIGWQEIEGKTKEKAPNLGAKLSY